MLVQFIRFGNVPERPLTGQERKLISQFAEKLHGEEKVQLLADLARASREEEWERGTVIVFRVAGQERPSQSGQREYPVEGRVIDSDGQTITVSLYKDETEHLFVLDLVREADGPILDPDWASLEFY